MKRTSWTSWRSLDPEPLLSSDFSTGDRVRLSPMGQRAERLRFTAMGVRRTARRQRDLARLGTVAKIGRHSGDVYVLWDGRRSNEGHHAWELAYAYDAATLEAMWTRS